MSDHAFHFDDFTAEELVAYAEWEPKQEFDNDLPSCLRVEHYNKTLPPKQRYDLFCSLPDKALEYQHHLQRSRLGGLMATGKYTDVYGQGRSDGYWQQPEKVYPDEESQFVYDMGCAQGRSRNHSVIYS